MPKYAFTKEFETALLKALNLEEHANEIHRVIIDCKPSQPVSVYVEIYPNLETPETLTGVFALLSKTPTTEE